MTDGSSLVLERVGPDHPGVREGVRRYDDNPHAELFFAKSSA